MIEDWNFMKGKLHFAKQLNLNDPTFNASSASLPGVSMTLSKWVHDPFILCNDSIFKGSWSSRYALVSPLQSWPQGWPATLRFTILGGQIFGGACGFLFGGDRVYPARLTPNLTSAPKKGGSGCAFRAGNTLKRGRFGFGFGLGFVSARGGGGGAGEVSGSGSAGFGLGFRAGSVRSGLRGFGFEGALVARPALVRSANQRLDDKGHNGRNVGLKVPCARFGFGVCPASGCGSVRSGEGGGGSGSGSGSGAGFQRPVRQAQVFKSCDAAHDARGLP